jgi:hypothetical protein
LTGAVVHVTVFVPLFSKEVSPMSPGLMLRAGWVALWAVLYAAFFVWYGGNGAPLTAAEGQALMARIRALHEGSASAGLHPEFRPNVEALIARDDGREFFMVNLETLIDTPEAREADAAYARIVIPLLLARGSFPIFAGRTRGKALGDFADGVQRVAIVRYRSLRDFLDMNADPAMKVGAPHKFASMTHTEVFPTAPMFTAVHVRLTVGLLFVVIAWAGLTVMNWFGRSKSNA